MGPVNIVVDVWSRAGIDETLSYLAPGPDKKFGGNRVGHA